MGQGLGQLSHVGIKKEGNWGDGGASTDYLKITSESITKNIEELVSEGTCAIRDEPESFEGLNTVEGDINMEFRPEAAGLLLESWFNGSTPTQQGATTAYKHEFVPNNTPFQNDCFNQSLGLQIYKNLATDQTMLFNGMVSNILAFNFGVGDKILNIASSMIGKIYAGTGVDNTPAFEDTEPFRWKQAIINVDSGIGFEPYTEIETLGINLDNGLIGIPTLNGTKDISKIVGDGFRMGTMSGTTNIIDLDKYYNSFNAWETSNWEIEFIGPQIGASGFNYMLTFLFPKVLYTTYPVNIPGSARIQVGFSAKLKYEASAGYLAKIELTNSKTSY